MKYAVVYSSMTGNTRLLADALLTMLPRADVVYFGVPDDAAFLAERLYVGFWTDKGSCDDVTARFLHRLQGKEVFLFGTAGFGQGAAYFQQVLKNALGNLNASNTVVGTYMCQGKMRLAVRERYEKMLSASQPAQAAEVEAMIENFDRALSHPDEEDLIALKNAVANCLADAMPK